MRLRILSSVHLPAPLRPMMPRTSPCLHLEVDILERPEFLDLVALHDLPPANEIGRPCRVKLRISWPMTSRSARVTVLRHRVDAVANQIAFGQIFDGDHRFRHNSGAFIVLRSDRQSFFPSCGSGEFRTTGKTTAMARLATDRADKVALSAKDAPAKPIDHADHRIERI